MSVKRKVASTIAELEETEVNVKKINDASIKHSQVSVTTAIRKDEERKIYKNIKVSREVEQKILHIKECREDRVGRKGSTFDSIVYEAILEYLDRHYEEECGE